MGKVGEAIASSSGAALGYIAGGLPGSYIGYKGAKNLYQNKMAVTKRKSQWAMVPYKKKAKASKRTKKRKRGLTRRTSKKIKSIVKRQLECDFNKSVFERNYHFQVTPFVEPGKQFYFNRGEANPTGPTFGVNDLNFNLRPLSPDKLLDAASVLYNGKDSKVGPFTFTGNFDVEKTSANIHYSSATYTLTNITDVEFVVHFFEFESRRNKSGDALGTFDDAIAKTAWVGDEPTNSTFGTYPTQFEVFKESYKTTKQKKFVLKPGQKKKFFYKFSGCVDFRKYMANNITVYSTARGFKEINFICYPTETLNFNVDPSDPTGATGVSYPNRTAPIVSPGRCLAVEVNEVYKIQQPDETADANEGNFRCLHNYTMPLETEGNGNIIQKFTSMANIESNLAPVV